MHLLLEINGQHSILHIERLDVPGTAEHLRLVFHADGKTTVLARISCFGPVEKLCITLRIARNLGVDGGF